ncbi:MAG: PEP-CTERM sorting domain-containing protein [Planctomycetota bacterium]
MGLRSVVLAIVFCGCLGTVVRAAPITGDIAVISLAGDFNAPDGDAFSWIPLVNLVAGDEIYFTDSSWDTDVSNDFNGFEGLLKYTVPGGGVAAGTVFYVDVSSLGAGFTNVGSAQTGNQDPLALANSGDQIAVFTDSSLFPGSSPDFIFAVNSNSSNWNGNAGLGSTSSNLYSGLTNGVNAVAAGAGPLPGDHFDNIYYNGPTTGDRATLLAAISNNTNWVGQNQGLLLTVNDLTGGLGAGGSFSVSPPPGGGDPPGGGTDPIPEPATMTLLALSAGAVALRRRRSRKS